MSEQELFNNVNSADTEFTVYDPYLGVINNSLGFVVSSVNFSGKILTRVVLYGGNAGLGYGTLRMWVATARYFAPNPDDGVTVSSRIYSTNEHEIQSVHTGRYEFVFSGLVLPSDSVLVFGLEIYEGSGYYGVIFVQAGVSTGVFPLYLGDVTSVPSALEVEVNDFQPVCIIYGTAPFSYSVVYDGNGNMGGTVPVDSGSPYLNTSTVTVLGNAGNLTKVNHVFIGWSTDPNAVVAEYVQGSTFVINGNVVLYAVWVSPRTVTYNGNGNSAGSAPVDFSSPYQHGSTVTVLGNTGGLWHALFNFAGWSTEPFDIWPTYAPGDTFALTEDTVLYAIWLYGGPPVGNLYSVNYDGNGNTSGYPPTDWTYPAGATVTVLGKNTLEKIGHTFLGWATTSNATTPNRMPGSTFGMPPNSIALYAVWGSGGGGGSTIVVPYNGRYVGSGSKQTAFAYTGASPIMQVAINLPNNTDSSAVIENLIIDGLNLSNNATGILLEDVCGCLVRNVTIMNCEVGIRVKLSGDNGGFSRDNRFEHIRMINVKTGILFEGTSNAKDFSYTTIEDVGISLAGNSTDAGIKVGNGNTNANLYSAFIKTNVWLNGSNGAGLVVNGQLKGSLVNLAVMESAQYNSGKCIVLNSGAYITVNQSFLSTSLGVNSNISNNGGTYSGIKTIP